MSNRSGAMDKRFVLSPALAAILFVSAATAAVWGQSTTTGLKDVYANHFRFGSILNGTTANNSTMRQIVLREFNSITPENELKPEATIQQSGSTNADVKVQLNNGAKAILKFCQDNNIPVRGHTLVWHSQTPNWFFRENFNASGAVVTPAVMDQRMESYIKNMFALIKSGYPNLNLYAYDVVNEAASESGSPRTAGSDAGNGQSMWVQVYGNNSFIEKAFTYARRYAPATTKLFYNDYNEYIQAKRDYIANSIVKPLKEKNLIDGVGMQSHLDVRTGSDPYPSATLYGQAVTIYKNLGVEIHVSELDATVNDGNESYFPAQATYYKNIMNEILTKGGSAVTAVVVWGIQDDQSWRKAKKPLLFDASGNKKAAYNELFKLIPQAEWGDGNNPGFGAPTVINPDANGYFFHHTYEDGTAQGWTGRGAATVANTNAQKANGARSLAVTGRTASWNGAAYSLNANAFVPGKAYSFSVLAMHGGPETGNFKFTMQYTLGDSTRYAQIAAADARTGVWTMLENANFNIPAGATGLLLYVEMPDNETSNFYIDDAMGGVAGAAAPGRQGVTSVGGVSPAARGQSPFVTVMGRTLAVNAPTGSKARVRVVNLTGKTVAAFKSTGAASFSLREIPAGAYIVEAARDGYVTRSAVTFR
jgi:arabinoxylan arabinofuranohydrolase